MAVSAAMAEPMKEDKEEEEDEVMVMGEGSSNEDLVHIQAPAPWATMPMAPRF